MALFQKSVLKKHLNHLDDGKISKRLASFYDFDFKTFAPTRRMGRLFHTYKTEINTLQTKTTQIDQMVYKLYGLTDEKITIVEGGL